MIGSFLSAPVYFLYSVLIHASGIEKPSSKPELRMYILKVSFETNWFLIGPLGGNNYTHFYDTPYKH